MELRLWRAPVAHPVLIFLLTRLVLLCSVGIVASCSTLTEDTTRQPTALANRRKFAFAMRISGIGNHDAIWTRTYEQGVTARGVCPTRTGFALIGSAALPRGPAWLAQLDQTGRLTSSATLFPHLVLCEPRDLLSLEDGSLLVTGECVSRGPRRGEALTGWDLFASKLDETGKQTWFETFGGLNVERGGYCRPSTDGGFFLAGTTWSAGTKEAAGWLVKTDAHGRQEWARTCGGNEGTKDDATAVEMGTGTCLVVGKSFWPHEALNYRIDLWARKFHTNGTSIWSRKWMRANDTFSRGFSCRGGLDEWIIASSVAPMMSRFSEWKTWIVKLDSKGEPLWETEIPGYLTSLSATESGPVLSTIVQEGQSRTVHVAKIGSNGNIEWRNGYPARSYREILSIIVTNDGGYIAAGFSSVPESDGSDPVR